MPLIRLLQSGQPVLPGPIAFELKEKRSPAPIPAPIAIPLRIAE